MKPRWRQVYPIAVIMSAATVIVVLTLASITLTYSERSNYQNERRLSVPSYSEEAARYAQCIDLKEPDSVTQCILETEQAGKEAMIKSADLRAQQDMAAFAHGLLWLTALASITGGFGLIALIWTFRETRKMTQADAKAYVEILHIEFQVHPTYGATLSFWLSNKGRTPAKQIAFTGTFKVEHWTRDFEEPVHAWLDLLPGNSVRIAQGEYLDILYRVSDIVPDYQDCGSHGRRTLTVATEEGQDATTMVLRGDLVWFDIYGNRESIPIGEIAQTHSGEHPNWLGNMRRPGKKNPD